MKQAAYAWWLAYGKQPAEEELRLSVDFLEEQMRLLSHKNNEQPVEQAMTNFCQALLTSNSFLYID